ncbi:MAG TPA: cation:proton antiporter [Methylomirabilota bacterium]|jgi:Kef-type K+ transport system membrane component KefB|nr:cation:proton antiporter [Methylomirabilota bacterium]
MHHNPVLPLLLAISLIFCAARLAGAAARKLGQPRVLGELLVGVALGPTLLNLLHWPVLAGEHLDGTIKELAELGVLILMFNIALEIQPRELMAVGRTAVYAGFLGAAVPLGVIALLTWGFGFPGPVAFLTGVVLAANSTSISAQTLLELGVLRTKEGNAMLATALVDDVLAITLVSISVALTGSATQVTWAGIVWVVVRMILFFAVGGFVAWSILPRVMNWIHVTPELGQLYGVPVFALAFALFLGWSAEILGGVAAISGTFLAGFGISRINAKAKHEVEQASTYVSYAFLVPIFFVSIGLVTDFAQLGLASLPYAGALIVASILTKVIGTGAGALLGGFDRTEALRLGVCMISRGEVGLIMASIGLARGIFDDQLFPSLLLAILVSTLVTPPLVRLVFRGVVPEGNTAEPTAAPAAGGR